MKIFEQENIKINLPVLIDSRMLLCANSGGGKSYAIRKILEETANDVMSIVLDYEGEFKTLREKFDFLLIGQPGDVPININAAHLLPQKLMELNVSAIIDISDFKLHNRILYVKKFLEALMELPQKYWKPCLVIIDEAHNLCGQQEKQDSAFAVIDLMTRGRKRGYCGILATQRISKLHKDAVAEANFYLMGRTSLDIDMNRAAEILGFATKADKLSLRTLAPGTFYFFDPRSDHGIEKVKITKAQTTHPKVGIDLRGKITPPTEKIKAMLSKLNDLPKEAEEKTKTLEDAKKEIRELKKQLGQRPAPAVDNKQIELAEKRGFAKAESQYKNQASLLIKGNKAFFDKLKKIAEIAKTGEFVMPDIRLATEIIKVKEPIVVAPATIKDGREIYTERTQKPQEIDGDVKLDKCGRSILSLLYNNPQRGFKKTLIGVFTGYSNKSGGFNNAICKLNAQGLIQRNGGSIILSEEGSASGAELLGEDVNLYETFTVANWEQNLPKCEGRIFRFLMDNPSMDFTKEEIGEQTGYSFGSGGFNNAICALNALGLIIRQGGRIKLNEEILEL
jgi:uncharacterized protein